MKSKIFKMSLILLFSIFSIVKSFNESGFDEFNQPIDSQGFIDQDKYMKNFEKFLLIIILKSVLIHPYLKYVV